MDTFTTRNNTKAVIKRFIPISFIPYAAFAAIFAFSLMISLKAFIIFEIFVFVCCIFSTILVIQKYTHLRIIFKGNKLFVQGDKKINNYVIYDVSKNDFIFRQSSWNKEHNCGSIIFKKMRIELIGIEKFDQVKKYVDENFS